MKNLGDKSGIKCYSATPIGLISKTFLPKKKTQKIIALYADHFDIIEVLYNNHECSTSFISKKININRRRTLDVLRQLETAGIVYSEKGKNNRLIWYETKHTGEVIKRLFLEICDTLDRPNYNANEEEISTAIKLIQDQNPNMRSLGLKYLKKLAKSKNINHDIRIINLFLIIINDPSYDRFKDDIIDCFLFSLPDPLQNPNDKRIIGKLDENKLVKNFQKREISELNKLIGKIYSPEIFQSLERYCYNKPWTPATIPLSLDMMRMINEELAVKNMIHVIEKPPYEYHYQYILAPYRKLSTPMKKRFDERLMDLIIENPDEKVRGRASLTKSVLLDSS
jgi:DNA-binding MarR family transcriptional regulator